MVKYYNELIYYVQKLTNDKEKSTDIIQETYTKTLEKSKNSNIENERAFLYKVARNLVIDQSRKKKKIQKIEFEEHEHSIPKTEQPEDIALNYSRKRELKNIINTLPTRSKQAFVLHVLKGYSRQEIAKIMGISVNAVQKHITRGTKKLQEQIDLDEWELYE